MKEIWVGADPGGTGKFGLAFLDTSGGLSCATVSSVDEALCRVGQEGKPLGLGIDAPMWWSSCKNGRRKADQMIRDAYGLPYKRVLWVNSLRGAALVGGAMLASLMRQEFGCMNITETHPKVLLKNCDLRIGCSLDSRLRSIEDEHERDAAVSAVCAKEGFEGRWQTDLARKRYASEQNPCSYWLTPMHYFWPECLD